MKERLHHFFTYVIFLCADYCFGAIHFNLPNQLTNTIYNTNWKNLKQDVENIKKNLIKNALDMSNESILNLKVEILKQPYGNLVCECTETEMSKSLLNLISDTKNSIFDYLKFINALAGFGQDKDIIKAAYDITAALLGQIDRQFREDDSNIEIKEFIKNIATEKTRSTALKTFHQACSKKTLNY